MSLWGSLKGFVREFRASKGMKRADLGPEESLARTIRESTHVRGGQQMMGLSRASTEQQLEIVVEGHENYTKSLHDKND
jgi:hypothetical protein